jgi:hypothetical protein
MPCSAPTPLTPGMPMGMADIHVFPHFGFTADNIVQQIRELLEGA